MVGFPGEGMSRYVYRRGCYAPVAVRLTLTNEDPRTVYVRLEQQDRDGDIIYTDEMVALTAGLDGQARQQWLYFMPNPQTGAADRPFNIQILDDKGDAVTVFHNGKETRRVELPDNPEPLPEELFLVLSIGTETAGKILSMSDHLEPDSSEFTKPLRVAHTSPDLVPDHWFGLEMVDAIVWDSADPKAMTGYQRQAILDWVRHGGRLLIAAGGTSDELKASEFRDFLPVEISGVKAENLLPEALLQASWGLLSSEDLEYDKPMQVAQCVLRQGADALVQSAGETQTYLARMRVGEGSITYLALTLRDLFGTEAEYEPSDFFRRALMLRRHDHTEQQENVWGLGEPVDLFAGMNQFVGFEKKTAIYMLIAILFVIAYGLLATWGSWFALMRRKMLKHSWTVFFLVSAAASLLGVLAVQAIQGVGTELHQLTIVDGTVDSSVVTAHGLFGLKTSSYVQDVEVWLPQGPPEYDDSKRSPHYLRPMSPKTILNESAGRFADTKRYRSEPSRAQLLGVPIRATLKQFEGYWRGTMGGNISARIRMIKNPSADESRFARGSVITNNLGHDLVDCYLIEAQRDPDESNLTGTRSGVSTIVHPIGPLGDGGSVDLYAFFGRLSTSSGSKNYPGDYKLRDFHKPWVKDLKAFAGLPSLGGFQRDPFHAITDVQRSILLLTTFAEYEPVQDNSNQTYYGGFSRIELSQANSRWLDRSNELTRRTMLLVGFAKDEEGPVMLYSRRGRGDWKYLLPDKKMTVYRFLIPVDRDS